RPYKTYNSGFEAGKTYVIEMTPIAGSKFDPYLQVADATGKKVLAEDDNGGGGVNAKITFTPTETGKYVVIATSAKGPMHGTFVLSIKEMGRGNNPAP